MHHTPFDATTVTSQGPTFNLRFPGQYYDAETGLHYNWHRYYDPGTGRYITSDPIGLAGGINTYAYALNNPITSVDPTGLCPWCLVGAVLGGGLNAAAQLSSGQDFDWGSFVASIATGGLGGGLGTVTRGLSWGQNIVVNTLGSGAIGAGVTVAKNEITGSCDDVWDSAKRSAFLGGLGSSAGNVLSGLGKQLPRVQALRWWRDASLTDRLFASSNAIYSSQQQPFVTTFFVTTGNAGSSLISNIPERGEQ